MKNTDPRGPERKIVKVDDASSSHTLVALDCGHVAEANQIYTYTVGKLYHCIRCKWETDGKHKGNY